MAIAPRRQTQLAEAVGFLASATVAGMATPVTAPAVGWWWEGWRSRPLQVGLGLQILHRGLVSALRDAGAGWQGTWTFPKAGVQALTVLYDLCPTVSRPCVDMVVLARMQAPDCA